MCIRDRYGYRRRVKVRLVWKPKQNMGARTDNGLIWINAGHPSVTKHKTRQERYEQVCGLFAHELGHVLYTDFLATQTYHRYQESGKWYPEPPPLRSPIEPVSYTHLDVYKRQSWRRSSSPAAAAAKRMAKAAPPAAPAPRASSLCKGSLRSLTHPCPATLPGMKALEVRRIRTFKDIPVEAK